jgi:hypothetical protein
VSLSADLLRSYRAPRRVLRRQLDAGPREDRALLYLVLACLLFFVAQWPAMSRAALIDPTVPFEARIGGALFALLFILPLLSYALAFLLWLALRPFAPISAFGARLALFWAMLAVSPLVLAQSALTAAMGAPGSATRIFGLLVLGAFLAILWGGLRAALEAGRAAA